jgi:hypothetical protein
MTKIQNWSGRKRGALLASTAAVLALVGIGAGMANGASSGLALRGGQMADVTCSGQNLTISPESPTSLNLTCMAAPHPTTTTAPPTTTQAPAPTTTTGPLVTTTTRAPATTTTTRAPTTTATTLPPASGTCTNPVQSSSNPQFTDNTDPGDVENFWVNNDAWSGSHGPQTIKVCSASSWDAVSNQPNIGGQVETYPDTEYDVGGRDGGTTKPISGFSNITSTFAESNPSDGSWDAGYDLWTNNWSNETMIWNQWAGSQAFWPQQANGSGGAALTLAGVPYHFFANGDNCNTTNVGNCELMFFRDTQTTSGAVDLLAAFQWEVAHGYAKASDVPTQLEYGTEIASTNGAETFNVTGLTFSVK